MFQPGELIVYGNTGVCRVEEITQPVRTGPDCGRQYYLLKPLYQDGIIYTPVDNDKVPMRPILSHEEAEALIDLIPSLQTENFCDATLQALSQHYQSVMRSYDRRALLVLIMSIYAKRQQAQAHKRRLGAVDERFMKQAERLLYSELSIALGIPFEEVQPYIAQRVTGGEKAGA